MKRPDCVQRDRRVLWLGSCLTRGEKSSLRSLGPNVVQIVVRVDDESNFAASCESWGLITSSGLDRFGLSFANGKPR